MAIVMLKSKRRKSIMCSAAMSLSFLPHIAIETLGAVEDEATGLFSRSWSSNPSDDWRTIGSTAKAKRGSA